MIDLPQARESPLCVSNDLMTVVRVAVTERESLQPSALSTPMWCVSGLCSLSA